jgi:VanZ family protein
VKDPPRVHLLWLSWLWVPVALDAGLIFYLSSIPDLPAPPGPFSDKHFHFASYAVLSTLLVRAFASARLRGVTARIAVLGFVLATLYGVTDEFHQSFVPGRTSALDDLAADALGAAAAAGLLLAWAIIRRRRRAA